ncbi:M20 aminoacylase family protein [Acuticoccus sp. I52.16.1]|uniref:M20 aminoacylase family protein n=1 Tax=Acuticoccus sp. I52.16.1 TaxID=2928472 RepID=UPI001FD50C67|nr:M20 aminoacylase family protein [Acuticoccus sp. I52.16.1]UOM33749.1 M20 family metallopeptidase [Acuticoccus sp. I52.16.1]
MPIVNRFADLADEIAAWRRDLHEHPEIGYDTVRTAAVVAERLAEFGCDEVVTGIGRTGVVGVIKGAGAGPTVGLRADMDALPILEKTGKTWTSKVDGKMHACGHDGHTAMLLGAAKYLAETRKFAGTVVLIFQPAEEGGGGAKAMIDDGLLTRFGIDRVFGMHNWPGQPVGKFMIRTGPQMASADRFTITVEGLGGHAARPHLSCDPIVAGSAIVTAAQAIVGRNVDPNEAAVVSVTTFHAGTADNIIPQSATLTGTVRTLRAEVRDLVEERLGQVVEQVGAAYGVKATLAYRRDYPVLSNHEVDAQFAGDVAAMIVGEQNVDRNATPTMGGEDFAFMLEERPGAFIFAGVGEDVANLHNESYDFNDELIPVGCSYWTQLVETALARAT